MLDVKQVFQTALDHHRAGRLPEAEQAYRRVLELQPRNAQAGHLLGLIAFQVGKHDLAVEYVTRAIQIDPFHAPFPADLGEIYRAMGRLPDAVTAYRQALKLNPEMPDAHTNLGTLLEATGEHEQALDCFREALKQNPKYAEAYVQLGQLLTNLGQLDEAQRVLETAVQTVPENAEAFLALGNCMTAKGDLLAAIGSYQKSLRLNPELAETHYRCGQARLSLGDFANGWPDFEWRVRCPLLVRRNYSLPLWNGQKARGQRVLVHAEHDPADTLQFIRYLPLIAEQGPEVVLDVQPELIRLLELAGLKNLVTDGQAPPPCNLQARLLSAPGIFRTRIDTIPAQVPYLTVPPADIAEWRTLLGTAGGFKVGIAWQADLHAGEQRAGSIPLAELAPLATVPGVRLLRLQKPAADEPTATIGEPLPRDPADMAEMAAVIANLDLLISPDAALAHLAGALGTPTWVALEKPADWRWMREGENSFWYPTLRLFRQSERGRWNDVFARIAGGLSTLVAARRNS